MAVLVTLEPFQDPRIPNAYIHCNNIVKIYELCTCTSLCGICSGYKNPPKINETMTLLEMITVPQTLLKQASVTMLQLLKFSKPREKISGTTTCTCHVKVDPTTIYT